MTEQTSEPLVEAVDLCVSSKAGALSGASFALPRGTVAGLASEPKGLGLLLLDCLGAIHAPDSGTVRIEGEDLYADALVRRRVSIVRGPGRFPYAVKVGELLDHVGLLMRETGGRERVCEELQLQEVTGAYAHDLRGEQQLLVRIACGLLGQPDVLLYDRLFQNLSPAKAAIVRRMVDRRREEGKAIVVAGDDLQALEGACDRVIVLAEGSLKAHDTVENLMRSGQNRMRIEVFTDAEVDLEKVRQLPSVHSAEREGDRYQILAENRFQSVHELVDFFRAEDVELRDLRTYQPTLADEIMQLL